MPTLICQTALHQKDADILISFRDTFYLFVTSYKELENEDLQELIINIKSNINDYISNKRTGYLKLSLTEILKSKLDFIDLIDDSFKEFLSDYSNSCDDFKVIGRIKDKYIKRFSCYILQWRRFRWKYAKSKKSFISWLP